MIAMEVASSGEGREREGEREREREREREGERVPTRSNMGSVVLFDCGQSRADVESVRCIGALEGTHTEEPRHA